MVEDSGTPEFRASGRHDLTTHITHIACRVTLLDSVHESKITQIKRAIAGTHGLQPAFACVPLAHPISFPSGFIAAKQL